MPDQFRKVQPGEPLSIPAQQFNTFVDTARIVRGQQQNQSREPLRAIDQPGIVLVKNSTGDDLDRFHILGIKETLITPGDNEQEFQNRVAFEGEKPDLVEHYGRFVVLAEPLKDGKIGRAYISGVCPVKLTVDDESYKFADIRHDDTGSLQACIVGSARILWKEEGTGEKWGVVRLSNADPQVYALDDCRNQKPTLFVLNDLANNLGEVVKVFDACYEVRPPRCTEIRALDPIVVPISGTYSDCDRCLNCWKLTRCDDNQVIRYANNDLADQENRVVKLDDGYCYLVELSNSCTSAESVTVEEDYADCNTCGQCYHLENCHDANDTIVVQNDLSKISEKSGPDMVTDGDVFEIDGKCYKVTAYDQDCTNKKQLEDEPTHYEDCTYCGCFKLTECDVVEPEILYANGAVDTDFDPVELREYVDEYVRLDNGKCYLVEESQDCNSTSEVTVLEAYETCADCICYTLTECDTSNTILTYTDLDGLGFELGDVIRVPADEKCYTITNPASWDNSAVGIEPEEEGFEDCPACTKQRKFLLTNDCQHGDCGDDGGNQPEIITTEDLHDAVGQYVKVEGHCYVIAETNDDVSDEDLDYQGPFPTCESCQAQPVTTRKRFVTRVFLDGDQIKASVEEMVLQDGVVAGFCSSDDEVIGDYCCEGGTSSSSSGV